MSECSGGTVLLAPTSGALSNWAIPCAICFDFSQLPGLDPDLMRLIGLRCPMAYFGPI